MKKQSNSLLSPVWCAMKLFLHDWLLSPRTVKISPSTLWSDQEIRQIFVWFWYLLYFFETLSITCVCIYTCPHVYLSWQFMLGVLFVTSVLQDMLRSVYEMVAYKNSATWLYFHFPHVHLWPTKNYFNTCNIFSLFSSRCVSIFVIVIEVWVFPKWIYVVVIYYSPALTPSQWWKVEGSCHWVEQKNAVSDMCC